MNFNKHFVPTAKNLVERWKVVDAKGQHVGRLATKLVHMVKGKDEPFYTPHAKTGHRIIVINADKVVFTGSKMEDKSYWKYTRYVGNKQTFTAKDLMQKDKTLVLQHAVKGMMQNSSLNRDLFENHILFYCGAEHPHKAQIKEASTDKTMKIFNKSQIQNKRAVA